MDFPPLFDAVMAWPVVTANHQLNVNPAEYGWYTRPMSIPIIETHRLRLRPFVLDDSIALHNILRVEGVLQYFPSPDPQDLERVEKLVLQQISHWEEHEYEWWAVEPIGNNEIIGWSGLQYLPETDEIEIGYLLAKPYWGRGLATEGARAGLDYGFKVLNIPLIIGIVHPENFASQSVLENIGLKFLEQTQYFGMECYKYIVETPVIMT
ncbi:MAG: GNAT family N-acetyltransferase [Anaerolineales bacterium]